MHSNKEEMGLSYCQFTVPDPSSPEVCESPNIAATHNSLYGIDGVEVLERLAEKRNQFFEEVQDE